MNSAEAVQLFPEFPVYHMVSLDCMPRIEPLETAKESNISYHAVSCYWAEVRPLYRPTLDIEYNLYLQHQSMSDPEAQSDYEMELAKRCEAKRTVRTFYRPLEKAFPQTLHSYAPLQSALVTRKWTREEKYRQEAELMNRWVEQEQRWLLSIDLANTGTH